jgi:hypothetical protein
MLFEMISNWEWNLRAIDYFRRHAREFFLAACSRNWRGSSARRPIRATGPGPRSKGWLKKCRGYAETREVEWEWWKK